jgi:hypothetical protein
LFPFRTHAELTDQAKKLLFSSVRSLPMVGGIVEKEKQNMRKELMHTFSEAGGDKVGKNAMQR